MERILTIKIGKVWQWCPGLGLSSYELCRKMEDSPENPQQKWPWARDRLCFADAKVGQPELI